jgi:hypothetical protein
MIVQALKNAGFTERITCPVAFAVAKKTPVSLREPGGYCTSYTIGIRRCRPGCFP